MHGPEESSPLVWLTVEGESRAVYSSHHYDRQSHSASRSLAMQLSALIAGTLLLCTGYSEAMGRSPRHIPGLAKVMASKAKQGNAVVSSAGFADYADIVESSLKQPLDHFDSSNKVTFRQRYWYSLRHYKPSKGKPTPIFVLDSGETDATGRLPYLDHGILDILANATGGIGVVLEHRYYGTSFPNRTDMGEGEIWGVDQLRFLNNSQSLQDSARFVQQMRFPEANNSNLRAPHSPVIYYGGSYAGARAAHMRVLYPDLIYGGIASSGVVAAIEDFPDYYYPISRGAQQDCTQAIQSSIAWIDSILAPEPWKGQHQPKRDASKAKQLMDIFGLGDLENPADFANVIGVPLGEFQGLNWDPSVSSNGFADFCTALVGEASGPVSPAPQRRSLHNSQVRFVQHNSSADLDVPRVVRNYAKYVKDNFALPCTNQGGTVEECFGTSDWSFYSNSTELNSAVSWLFQVCSTVSRLLGLQRHYLLIFAPLSSSGVIFRRLLPSL